VTHEQDIARYAKRILVLKDGRIVEDTPDIHVAVQSLHRLDEAV
jgi:ABC-type lipoprotein export system ATPase subunit